MGSQRVARPSLERGMEAASGKKRTPQHEGVPYNVPHTPFHPQWSFARVLPHPRGHPQASARAFYSARLF